MADIPLVGKMFGIELEFFLIDKEGKIANRADDMLSSIKQELIDTELKQECGHAMIELTSFPHISHREVFGKFFHDFETLIYEAEEKELGLFCYGTYPGKNTNIMRTDARYDVKKNILGEENFQNAGKCIGFHYHYSLPKKSFNNNISFFYPDIKEKSKAQVLSLFNFYAAIDPAISAFMQSSPYHEKKYLGKDSRAIVYRGDNFSEFKNAVYSNQPDFGTLNEYEPDFKTMSDRIIDRTSRWKDLLRKYNMGLSEFAKKDDPSILDSSWKPVKISPHGTVESRGADMNSMLRVISVSSMLKILSKHIQNNSIQVLPSETGTKEPFTLEEGVLHVPLQDSLFGLAKKSIFEGFDDPGVLDYSKRLLAMSDMIDAPHIPFRPLSDMIDEKKTMSDRIIDYVKKKQGSSNWKEIEDETAEGFALKTSDIMFKELILAKKISEKGTESLLNY